MYISKLIQFYNKNYGFWSSLIESIKKNRLILIPLTLIIVSSISFYLIFVFKKSTGQLPLMICSISVFIVALITGYYIKRSTVNKIYGSFEELDNQKLRELNQFVKDEFNLYSNEDLSLLDTLVNKEVEEAEELFNFPFTNTIRQLFVGVLITGLLSYSFKQLLVGNKELATSLLALYIAIMGTIFMIGTGIYNFRDFSKKYKLKQISGLITELQLYKFKNRGRVSAIIKNEQNYFLCALRYSKKSSNDIWEFLKGEVKSGEDNEETLKRIIAEELSCEIKTKSVFYENVNEDEKYIVYVVTLKPQFFREVPFPQKHSKFVWLQREDLNSLKWVSEDIPVLNKLKGTK